MFIVAVSAMIQAWTGWQGQQQVAGTRRQLEMMAAQQRPWLAPDVPTDGYLNLTDDGFIIGFDLPIKNTGEVAATEVRIDTAVVGDPIEGDARNFEEASLRTCATARVGPADALFPGETKTIGLATVARYRDDKSILHVVGSSKYLTPVVVGCISYRSAADGQFKRTPFAFEVTDPNWKVSNRHWRLMKAIPYRELPDLVFERARTGGGSPN